MQSTTTFSLLAGLAALLSPVLAQTYSLCDPMNVTCDPNPALGTTHNFVFDNASVINTSWNVTAGSLTYGDNGTEFTVKDKGDSPTIQSQFYIFWGSVSVIMKAATGQGIISSIVLESDDLDEVDWEFIGGNNTSVETNYFGKGNTTAYDRAFYYAVDNPTGSFHNYTVDWTSERLQWWIDDTLVRTLAYGDALGGYNFPQTPMNVRIGIWAGGDPDNSEGTIEWAGGETNYDDSPYTMYVKSAMIQDYSTGSAYNWTDKTGSFDSISAVAGTSTVAQKLLDGSEQSAAAATATSTSSSNSDSDSDSDSTSTSTSSAASGTSTDPSTVEAIASKWDSMSSGAKIGVYCGAGAGAALLISGAMFACMRQRRAGRKEREEYNARIEKEREDVYRDQMELRNKGLGGWDDQSSMGEDSLGGWAGNNSQAGAAATKQPGAYVDEVPSRTNTPGVDRSLTHSPGVVSPVANSPHGYNADSNSYGTGYNSAASPSGFDFHDQQGWPQQSQPQQPTRSFSQSTRGYQRF